MPRFMLDTNICIYLMKNQPPEVAQRFADCFVGDVVISAITLAELEYGVACSGKQKAANQSALDAFVREIPALPFDAQAAAAYGPVRLATREKQSDALDMPETAKKQSLFFHHFNPVAMLLLIFLRSI
jgi:tRNA(fMet)-specific endonuclease VapC